LPTYVYGCSNCEIEFEIIQGINELAVADCPHCDKITSTRLPQPFMLIDKTPHTLGSIADKQRSEMGRYQYDDTVQKMANERRVEFKGKLPEGTRQIEPVKDRPWWRTDSSTPDYKILKASPEKITDYVITGDRPAGT
jgi:putative FmdB family regulatory protein